MSRSLVDQSRAIATQKAVYRPELDILRFFAFFSVFLFHTAIYPVEFYASHHVPKSLAQVLSGFLSGGKYGVDLFFVLSSYLITDLLLREKERFGSLNVRFFYLRRILRIWPLYYFVILFLSMLPLFDPTHDFRSRYALPFIFLAGNWAFVLFGGPPAAASPLWSVSIEEQFYLFWPPVVAKLSRRQVVWAAIGLAFVANISRIALLAAGCGSGSMALWANTLTHLDSIAAGILVATAFRGKIPSLSVRTRASLMICGLVGIFLRGYILYAKDDSVSIVTTLLEWPAVALSCAAILISFIGCDLRLLWLQYLGKISYGLYVYHFFAIAIADRLLSSKHLAITHGFLHAAVRECFSLSITIAMAALSYTILEKPFLKLKEKFTVVRSRPV